MGIFKVLYIMLSLTWSAKSVPGRNTSRQACIPPYRETKKIFLFFQMSSTFNMHEDTWVDE